MHHISLRFALKFASAARSAIHAPRAKVQLARDRKTTKSARAYKAQRVRILQPTGAIVKVALTRRGGYGCVWCRNDQFDLDYGLSQSNSALAVSVFPKIFESSRRVFVSIILLDEGGPIISCRRIAYFTRRQMKSDASRVHATGERRSQVFSNADQGPGWCAADRQYDIIRI